MIHIVKGFGIVTKAEVYVFLELSCYFHDPMNVGNLISGSSAFSESSLNIWKFTVHVLLKPSLVNFEQYFTSMWDECSCVVVWAFFGIAFLALTIWTFVHKVRSVFFNMLSRLVIDFLPSSKCLLISWPQSSSAVILEPKKIKYVTVSFVSPFIWHEVMDQMPIC